jgi:hypothetical protein
MHKLLLPLSILFLAACGSKEETNTSASAEGYTKEIDYAVDASGIFHPDLADEDFTDMQALMTQMIADVLSGKLQAFDPMDFSKSLTIEEVKSKLITTDSVYIPGPDSTEMVLTVIQTDHSKEFYSIKFREQWKYAPDGAIIDRKVLAVAPRSPVYSTDGDILGHSSLFWIKVKE